MSKSKKSDELIRTAFWQSFLDLMHFVAEVNCSKAKKEPAWEQMRRIQNAFNAAWFRDPGILDMVPEQVPKSKSPSERLPATKRKLKLISPPTVH
jgi:hypothetical protein